MKQLRRLPPSRSSQQPSRRHRHRQRTASSSASSKSSVVTMLSRKNSLVVCLFALVTFSVFSLVVQFRTNGAFGLMPMAEEKNSNNNNNNGNLLSVPNPNSWSSERERKRESRREIRQLVDSNNEDKKQKQKEDEKKPKEDKESTANASGIVSMKGDKNKDKAIVATGDNEKDDDDADIVAAKEKEEETEKSSLSGGQAAADLFDLQPGQKNNNKAATIKPTSKPTLAGTTAETAEDTTADLEVRKEDNTVTKHDPAANTAVDRDVRVKEQKINRGDRYRDRDRYRGIDNRTIELPNGWHTIRLGNRGSLDEHMLPSDYVMNANPVDVLGEKFDQSSLRRSANLTNDLPHLGVLLDAGRHYFPVKWIKRMIDVLSIMNYNLLHFRLTDDQTFNVQLESQPLLAYPTQLNNNTKVYSPKELRDIVKYAKSKGIGVVPEINVPGHSGSWGGVPELIIQCPKFICKKGYGIPLNVSHPKLRPVLRDVLKEIIDIFDNPPYLHLGGDEVNMAKPCFDEVGEKMFDYNHFEHILKTILMEIRYNESQVIRWEMSDVIFDLKRAGKITHFWLKRPGERRFIQSYGSEFDNPVFLSSDLYFDTNEEDSAFDVYIRTKLLKHNKHPKSPILGIIGGTFELNTQFWLDRNVIGRLLAVSMGVSNTNITDHSEFFDKYSKICKSIGFDDTMCNLYGLPPIRYAPHRLELKTGQHSVWEKWINNTCDRLTIKKTERISNERPRYGTKFSVAKDAKERFWGSYFKESEWKVIDTSNTTNKRTHLDFRGKSLVNHTGIIMDIAQYPVDGMTRLEEIIFNTMSQLGFNTIQLRLITDHAFAYNSKYHPRFFNMSPIHVKNSKTTMYSKSQNLAASPQIRHFAVLKDIAAELGVTIMPEVSITTNAGGMYATMFNVECPNFLCEHGMYIPQDIESEHYAPVVYSIIRELLEITSSQYIHLGHDERKMSTPCFLEASNNKTTPNFDHFETKLSQMLEFAGVTSDRVLRWENNEKIHYPGRFGDVTQCSAGESCRLTAASKEKNGMSSSSPPWFGTVNVRRGGPYEIYSTTRDLASHSPTGLMAEIGTLNKEGYNADMIDYRLMAFSIGTLDLPPMEKDEFLNFYVKTCSKVTFGKDDGIKNKKNSNSSSLPEVNELLCRTFATMSGDAVQLVGGDEEKQWVLKEAICKERTTEGVIPHMRDPSNIATAKSMQA